MKKIIAFLLSLILVVSCAACASKQPDEPIVEDEPTVEAPVVEDEPVVEEDPTINEPAAMPEEDVPAEMPEVDAPVEDEMPAIEFMPEEKLNELCGIMDQLVGGINDELVVMTSEITSDMYEYFAIPAVEGAYAVGSMPMIGSIAHEVILVEVPEGTDPADVAAQMEANMNPRKWVCVEAEATWVKTSGQYVVMVMSTADMAAAIEANFNTAFGA